MIRIFLFQFLHD